MNPLIPLAAVLAFLGLVAGAWACGRWILRRFGLEGFGPASEIALAAGLGLAVFSYVVFLLNAVHAATPTTLAAAWLVWTGAGVAGFIRLPKPKFLFSAMSPWAWLLLAGLAVQALLNVVPALTPAVDWDGVAYHLALPKLYLQAGGFVFRPDIFHNLFPQFTEMLFQPALLLPYGIAAKIVHAGFGVLAALAVYAAVRESKAGRLTGLLAAAFFYGQYLVHVESGTAFIDLASAAYTGLALLAFTAGFAGKREKLFLLGFLFLGVSAATKWHGLIVAGLAWLLAMGWLAADRTLAWPQKIRRMMLAGVCVMLPVAPYLARAWLMGGNPFWPLGYAIFGGREWDAEIATRVSSFVRQFAGMAPGWEGFLRLPYDLLVHGERFGVGGPQLRFPLMGAALAIAGVGFLGWKKKDGPQLPFRVWTAAMAGLAFVAVWFHSSPQVRFGLALFPAVAWAAGLAVNRLWQAGRGGRMAALAAAFLVLAVRPAVHRDTPYHLQTLWGQVTPAGFITRYLPHYPACAYLNQHAAGDDTILLFGENRGFFLDNPYLWGDPMIQKVVDYRRFPDPESLAASLSGLGVRWVLYRTDLYGPDYLPPGIVKNVEAVLARRGELKAEFGPVRVYKLRP